MYGVLIDTVLYITLETNHSDRKIVQDLGLRSLGVIWPEGYKTFFMLI